MCQPPFPYPFLFSFNSKRAAKRLIFFILAAPSIISITIFIITKQTLLVMQSNAKRYSLNDVLFSFKKGDPLDDFTLRNAVQGIQIFGAIGSGKTSGSGEFIAKEFLKYGFGGIVLTGKIGEDKMWRKYAEEMGRTDDMVYFSEASGFQFNPLAYEMSRTDRGGQNTETMTDMFIALNRLGSRIRGGSGKGSDDPFWDMSLERLTKATLDILKLAGEDLSVFNMVRLIRSVPQIDDLIGEYERYIELKTRLKIEKEKPEKSVNSADDDLEDDDNTNDEFEIDLDDDQYLDDILNEDTNNEDQVLKELLGSDAQEYQLLKDDLGSKYLILCLDKIDNTNLSTKNQRSYDIAKEYFLIDFSVMPEKTRVSVVEIFYAFCNPFRSGTLAEYFAQGLSYEVMPERTFEGKVIVLDFPVKSYGKTGLFAQALYKKIWQQAVERRHVDQYTVPVMMWIDEAQYFLNEDDMMFQTTARASRTCSVFLSQNISNYYATIGSKERVDSLLGNLVTKIFHANNDYVMNTWAADTISKTKQQRAKGTMEGPGMADFSESLEYQVTPQEFTMLETGGPDNKNFVGGIVTSIGRTWSTGTNYLRTWFRQSKL
jgi:hypothetical protein